MRRFSSARMKAGALPASRNPPSSPPVREAEPANARNRCRCAAESVPFVMAAFIHATARSTGFAAFAGVALAALLSALLGACASKPMLPFTTETPPVVLAPVGPASGIADERGRFRQTLCAINADHGRDLPDYRDCDDILWRLAGESEEPAAPVHLGRPRLPLRVVVVGGLASECTANFITTLPLALQHLMKLGYASSEILVPGLGSTTYNGRLIAREILAMDLDPGERLVLVGHSKGLPDILEGIATSPDAARRVAAVVGIAGAVNGSPLVETAPKELFPVVRYMPNSNCRLGDGKGLESLGRDRRLTWLADHSLPKDVRFYSLAAFVNREQTSLALRDGHDRLSQIDPRNDGQLLFYDQIIPRSTLLGFIAADHWATAMPLNRIYPTLSIAFAERASFPREIVLEAVLRQIEEDLLQAETRSATPAAFANAPRARGMEPSMRAPVAANREQVPSE